MDCIKKVIPSPALCTNVRSCTSDSVNWYLSVVWLSAWCARSVRTTWVFHLQHLHFEWNTCMASLVSMRHLHHPQIFLCNYCTFFSEMMSSLQLWICIFLYFRFLEDIIYLLYSNEMLIELGIRIQNTASELLLFLCSCRVCTYRSVLLMTCPVLSSTLTFVLFSSQAVLLQVWLKHLCPSWVWSHTTQLRSFSTRQVQVSKYARNRKSFGILPAPKVFIAG